MSMFGYAARSNATEAGGKLQHEIALTGVTSTSRRSPLIVRATIRHLIAALARGSA